MFLADSPDLSSEDGFTLVELLVVLLIGIVVLGAVVELLQKTYKIAPAETARADAISEDQVGLDRMTRELSQAYQLNPVTAATSGVSPSTVNCGVLANCIIDFDIVARQSNATSPPTRKARRIRYDCSSNVNVRAPHVTNAGTIYTGCMRYAGPLTTFTPSAANGGTPLQSLNLAAPTSANASPGTPLVDRVMNFNQTTYTTPVSAGGNAPIFQYLDNTSNVVTLGSTCSAVAASSCSVRAVRITLRTPGAGERATGTQRPIWLQTTVDLRAIDVP